jgi:integrase
VIEIFALPEIMLKEGEMGTVYRRKNVFWIKYYRNGKPYYESTRSKKKEVAKRFLQGREGEISKGELPGIRFDKVRFDELAEDFLTDYRINRKRTLDKATCSAKHLKELFGGMKVTEITTAKIKEYVDKRMTGGLSNASINRELAAFKRIFHLAAQCTPPKVGQIPYIPMLKESNTRKGFFEHEEYLALRDALPSHLRSVVTFAYHTGWRLGEIRGLTWDKVDLKQGTMRLDPGETKNEEARTIYLNDELMTEMKVLHSNRRLGCPYVFHLNGEPIGEFRKSWKTACIDAGVCEVLKDEEGKPVVVKDKKGNEKVVKIPTKIFHDFRRTAIRNMNRSGIPERVAMKISGHKTRSVFDRYNIVSDQDLKEAARKQQAHFDSQTGIEMVTKRLQSGDNVVFFEARANG